MKRHQMYLLTAALGLIAPLAMAQSVPMPPPATPAHSASAQQHMQHRWRMHRMARPMGAHRMPATVTSVDHSTGMVNVTSEGMSLQVHFPGKSLTDIKAGDKIMLRLSFRKITPEMEARMQAREKAHAEHKAAAGMHQPESGSN